jgi:hypothetical protein
MALSFIDILPLLVKLEVGFKIPDTRRIVNTKRTHIVIPEQLIARIDAIVGKRGRSKFLAQAAQREHMRLGQIKALEAAAGSWKDQDYPELKRGAVKWVDMLRREDEKRFRQVAAR